MRRLRRPSDGQLIEYLLQAAELPLTESASPQNLVSVGQTICLGHGAADYHHAASHLLNWSMIPTEWVELFWPQRPVVLGTTVALGMWVRGVYWLNPCRITAVTIEPEREPSGDLPSGDLPSGDLPSGDLPSGDAMTRVVWRTVAGHSLVGEQSFTVRHCGSTEEVHYEILGLAEPAPWLRMHARPIHALRESFAEQSCAAMQQAMDRPPARVPPHLGNSVGRKV